MTFFKRIFKKGDTPHTEEHYRVLITDDTIEVVKPDNEVQSINWGEIEKIVLVNTDEGPFKPDVWLTLVGNNKKCSIPQGSDGYDAVFEIVSKYSGFDFANVTRSMTTTDNAEFIVWQKT